MADALGTLGKRSEIDQLSWTSNKLRPLNVLQLLEFQSAERITGRV